MSRPEGVAQLLTGYQHLERAADAIRRERAAELDRAWHERALERAAEKRKASGFSIAASRRPVLELGSTTIAETVPQRSVSPPRPASPFMLAMDKRGMSSARLAALANEKIGFISSIRRGGRPSAVLRKKLAQLLQLDEAEIWPAAPGNPSPEVKL